jgi:hypothetical protein
MLISSATEVFVEQRHQLLYNKYAFIISNEKVIRLKVMI